MTVVGSVLMETTAFYIFFIVFIATLIRSTFGFGEGLIAVPLLALVIPIEIATPLVVLLSIRSQPSWLSRIGEKFIYAVQGGCWRLLPSVFQSELRC